jgi:hypothetical protein
MLRNAAAANDLKGRFTLHTGQPFRCPVIGLTRYDNRQMRAAAEFDSLSQFISMTTRLPNTDVQEITHKITFDIAAMIA